MSEQTYLSNNVRCQSTFDRWVCKLRDGLGRVKGWLPDLSSSDGFLAEDVWINRTLLDRIYWIFGGSGG